VGRWADATAGRDVMPHCRLTWPRLQVPEAHWQSSHWDLALQIIYSAEASSGAFQKN